VIEAAEKVGMADMIAVANFQGEGCFEALETTQEDK